MGWYNEHKFVSVLCTHWSWWWVWWWKWRGGGWRWNSKRLPHPLYRPPFLLQSSSYHPRIFSVSSSYHPHILSDVGCGGGVEMEVGGMWEMWVIAAFEGLARQHQDGMGWDGTDPPRKNIFFAAVALQTTCICQGGGLNPTQVTIETVSWIGPNLFPFLCQSPFYFGKSCSRTYPSQSISALVLPQEAVSVPRKMKPFVSCTPGLISTAERCS